MFSRSSSLCISPCACSTQAAIDGKTIFLSRKVRRTFSILCCFWSREIDEALDFEEEEGGGGEDADDADKAADEEDEAMGRERMEGADWKKSVCATSCLAESPVVAYSTRAAKAESATSLFLFYSER